MRRHSESGDSQLICFRAQEAGCEIGDGCLHAFLLEHKSHARFFILAYKIDLAGDILLGRRKGCQ
jgi:hypothetical protein